MFNLHKKILSLIFIVLILCTTLNSCKSNSIIKVKEEMQITALDLVKKEFDKIISLHSPIVISPGDRFQFQEDDKNNPFNPRASFKKKIFYNIDGKIFLPPGDYVIPVMTYCMNSSGSSPDKFNYILAQFSGERALIIRTLNSRALRQFSPWDIQILSWSIQNGLVFEELNSKSKEIINSVIPEFKDQLSESILSKVQNKWDDLAFSSQGVVPSFDQASDEVLKSLGKTGVKILEMVNFRNKLKYIGDDTSRLKTLISTIDEWKNDKNEINSWSKYSDQILVRFKTSGHYQEIGQLQVRILSNKNKRSINSISEDYEILDISNLIADPMNLSIQPLTFSLILGAGGVILVPLEIISAPELIAAMLATVLADKIINWDSFFLLKDKLNKKSDDKIKELIKNGNLVLQKAHDQLEKPLRDYGILDKKSKNSSVAEKKKVREYTKSGGNEELIKDFEKIQGEELKSKDNKVRTKVLPKGIKVVMRPKSISSEIPTIEVQPTEESSLSYDLRVKVRYL